MSVPLRYILAALAFGIAALGFVLLPADASADCNGCTRRPPPSCHSCNPPAPPPQTPCCTPPAVVAPPPHVPAPNIVVVNAGARAQAAASAVAIAVANVRTGDTVVRQNMVVEGGASAAVTSSAMAVTEASLATETVSIDRDMLIQAICVDERGNPHPASQTFGGRDVAQSYRGEVYRCMSGTRMRYTIGNESRDCAAGEALWYQNGRVECRPQSQRRPCNERSLLRRYGPGDKLVRVREAQTRQARQETTFTGAMTMDGGVGQTIY